MKRLLLLFGLFSPLFLHAANPAFSDFSVNQFGVAGNKVVIKSGATVTNLSMITPTLGVAVATSVNGTTVPTSKTLVVTTDTLSVLAATTSAELAGVISDENDPGSGKLIFSPGTLNITSGKTLAATATLTLSGTDATTMTFPSTTATIARTDAGQTFTGTQNFGVVNHSAVDTITLALDATPTDGLVLTNSTVATVGAQKYSPALHLGGSGWKTDATAAAQPVDWRVYSVPVQGAAAPTANLNFDYSVNGGAYANRMFLRSDGSLNVPFYPGGISFGGGVPFGGGVGIVPISAGVIRFVTSGGEFAITANRLQVGTAGIIGFSGAGDSSSSPDLDFRKTVAGVPNITDGSTARAGWNFQWHGQSRVATQFDKTTTTLGDVTGLTSTLKAGRTYVFRAVLHITADAVGGHKLAMAGTCTATSIIYQINSIANTSNANVITSRQTALGGSAGAAADTSYFTTIEGTITVNAAGTLTVQFAQNAAAGTSSVLVGSNLEIKDVQ